jgi:aspartate ammonia-lyase
VVKESIATGHSIIDIVREKKLLTEEQLREILDPARMTEPVRPLDAAKKREEIKAK